MVNEHDLIILLLAHKSIRHVSANLISTVVKRKFEECVLALNSNSTTHEVNTNHRLSLHASSDKYNSYCAGPHLRTEIVVRNAINANFEGFIHNKTIDFNCRKCIDHYKLIEDTYLVIETDENGHPNYNKTAEMNRCNEFHKTYGKRWIWIRFNPSSNREKRGNKTSVEYKIKVLMAEITEQVRRIKNFENNSIHQAEYKFLFY